MHCNYWTKLHITSRYNYNINFLNFTLHNHSTTIEYKTLHTQHIAWQYNYCIFRFSKHGTIPTQHWTSLSFTNTAQGNTITLLYLAKLHVMITLHYNTVQYNNITLPHQTTLNNYKTQLNITLQYNYITPHDSAAPYSN